MPTTQSPDKLLAAIVARVDTASVAHGMVQHFRAQIEAYRQLPEQLVHGQIAEISKHNLELFFATLAEERALREDELEPFRESARRRAADGLPLEDLLHAYRLGGRLGWEALVDAASPREQAALLPSVARLMEYIDRVSDAVTETYHDERRHLMSAEERRIHDLFDRLVAGGPLDAQMLELAEQLGFPIVESYLPFAASLPGAPAHSHASAAATLRARRILALTEGERVVGLFDPAAGSAPVIDGGALIGLAAAMPPGRLADALDDARMLLEVGVRLGYEGVITADQCHAELLLARSPQAAAGLRKHALGPLEDYSVRRSADLLETLEVFFTCDLDRRRAAQQLHVHPNTLDYRLRRIEELTELRFARPDDLVLVALALKQRRLDPPSRL